MLTTEKKKRGKVSFISQTRIKLYPDGKVEFVNNTEPTVEFKLKINTSLTMFNGDKMKSLYDLKLEDVQIFFKRRYVYYGEFRRRNHGRVPDYRWTSWKPYPIDQIEFVKKKGRPKKQNKTK